MVQLKGHRWEISGLTLCHNSNGVTDGFLALGTNQHVTSHHSEAGSPVSCSSVDMFADSVVSMLHHPI